MRITAEFEASHTLRDGTEVRLRMIRPEDGPVLREGFERLSPESRYRRFLGGTSALTDEMIRYLCDVDGINHVAVVAVTHSLDLKNDVGMGVGRFVRIQGEPDVAEAAVTVIDEYQRRGVGKLLLETLTEAAAERDVRKFRAEVLASNEPMQRLLAEVSATEHARVDDVIIFDVPIGPPAGGPLPRQWEALYQLFRATASSFAVIVLGYWPWRRSTKVGAPEPRASRRAAPALDPSADLSGDKKS